MSDYFLKKRKECRGIVRKLENRKIYQASFSQRKFYWGHKAVHFGFCQNVAQDVIIKGGNGNQAIYPGFCVLFDRITEYMKFYMGYSDILNQCIINSLPKGLSKENC